MLIRRKQKTMNMAYKRRKSENAFDVSLPDSFSLLKQEPNLTNNESYKEMFFKCQNELLKVIARKTGFDLSVLTIATIKPENLTKKRMSYIENSLREILNNCLRKTDQVLVDFKNNAILSIVLPGTHIDNINIVIDKINETISESGLFSDDIFLFNYYSLHKNSVASA